MNHKTAAKKWAGKWLAGMFSDLGVTKETMDAPVNAALMRRHALEEINRQTMAALESAPGRRARVVELTAFLNFVEEQIYRQRKAAAKGVDV